MEQFNPFINHSACNTPGGPGGMFPGSTPSPWPPSPMMPGSTMQSVHGMPGGMFPGPTPSPWPPSPMMPGPTMQSGMEGHSSMGHHTHPGDPIGQQGFTPAAMPHPYLHEAYRFGTSFTPFPPEAPARVDNTWLGLDFHNDQFWKGVVLGSLLTILITSETVRETLMKGVAKVWTGAKSGVEELKEKFEDLKAEILYKKKKEKIEEAEKKVEGEGV